MQDFFHGDQNHWRARLRHFFLDLDARIDFGLYQARTWGRELYERLTARLGDEAVCALAAYPDHRPEYAWRSAALPVKERMPTPAAPRPLWLLAEPLPLAEFLREALPGIVLLDGPERIEGGWWDGGDVRRDYFVGRADSGQTLWVFKHPRRNAGWQVHGIFA